MKALSVRQPWAELIARGIKRFEVRHRTTHYRGPLLICASARIHALAHLAPGHVDANALPRACAVCVVSVIGARPGTAGDTWGSLVDPTGCFVWELDRPRRVEPFPVVGRLSFFEVADELIRVAG